MAFVNVEVPEKSYFLLLSFMTIIKDPKLNVQIK